MNKQKGNILVPILLVGSIILSVAGIALNQKTNPDYESQILKLQQENTLIKEDLKTSEEITSAKLGAFRPSNYVGKLLTRLNEGGVESTFQTTPGTARDGSTLTTAKTGDFLVFTINPGAANEEKISASAVSVSGTTATWTIINRGLSFTENVAITANKKQHAVGETVIISNDDHYLAVQYPAKDQDETITGQWTFTSLPITASTTYASETVAGSVELATSQEIASGTSVGGTGNRLAIGANLASSTYNSSASKVVVVTDATNKIDSNFISTSTLFANLENYVASSSILTYTATTTAHVATYTYTKPARLKYVLIRAVGGGGGGVGLLTDSDGGKAGGGGGGYCENILSASILNSTTSIQVGNGGVGSASESVAGTTGGNSSFGSFCTANGGEGGGSPNGGSGGSASNGIVNSSGGGGGGGVTTAGAVSGVGGSSLLGGGGRSSGPDGNGAAGGNYGGGGSGAARNGSGAPLSGGSGASGIVIITQYFY